MSIEETQQLTWLPIGDIRPADANDRTEFDEAELYSLSQSIAAIGLGTPIVVRPTPGGSTRYQIVAGERRWRAHQLPPCAHLSTIKTIIDTAMSDAEAEALMMAENLGRIDLGIMEEARTYAKRIATGLTVDEIAVQAGVAKFRVQWRLDLLDLCEEAQAALDGGLMPPACALELRRLGRDHQIAALKAWMANPLMGHLPFKRKCVEWADAANQAAEGGLFDTSQWEAEAVAIKPKTSSVPTLRKAIADLLSALELCARTEEDLAVFGPVIDRARDLI